MEVPHGYASERNAVFIQNGYALETKEVDMRDASYKIRWYSLTGEICTFVWLAIYRWSLDGLVQKGYTVC